MTEIHKDTIYILSTHPPLLTDCFRSRNASGVSMPGPSRTIHPRTRLYAASVAEDSLLLGRTFSDAFGDLEEILCRASYAGEIPHVVLDITESEFESVWCGCRPFAPTTTASTASIAQLPLHLGPSRRSRLFATVVFDVATQCVTGLAAHRRADDQDVAVRALNHAISIKHRFARRLPGCVCSWSCAGIPSKIEVPPSLDQYQCTFSKRSDELGIFADRQTSLVDWETVKWVLAASLRTEPSTSLENDISAIERCLTVGVVDILNQRILGDGSTPHRRWLGTHGAGGALP